MTKELREMIDNLEEMKKEVRQLLNDNKVDDAEKKMEEVRALQKKIDMQKELEEEEKRNVEVDNMNKKEMRKDNRELELRALGKFLARKQLTEEERAAITTTNGAAILPQGFVQEIENLRKGYVSLKDYVHVVPVSTNTGKMPLSKGMATKQLADLQHDTEIVRDMVTLQPVEYTVADYGKIVPVENSVLEDTTTNFMSVLSEDFIECAINTENAKIVEAIKSVCAEVSGSTYIKLQNAINKLSPAAKRRAIIVTNSTGVAYLDELTDKNDRPLLKQLTDGGKLMFKGLEVVEVDSEILPDEAGADAVFYVVDARKLIKFFDRKGYEIGVSSEAGFTYNQTLVRMIERFDVKAVADSTDEDVQKFAVKVVITNA